jgi:hemoglobin-like flavoprotein
MLVRSTYAQVEQIADTAAELFYVRLFAIDPSVRPLFANTDMKNQGKKLMHMIGSAVRGLDRLDEVMPHVQAMGRRHLSYGVTREQYSTVGQALLWTLAQGLGTDFTPEVKEAWTTVYEVLAKTAIDAAYGEEMRLEEAAAD